MRPVSKPSRAFRPRLTPALATTTSTTEMIDAAESMVTSEETLRIGSLRFTRYDNTSTGEPLLYVPGIEFRGISIAAQLPRLAANGFDPWYCWLDGDDRTPFEDVVTSIATFAKRELRDGIIVGESLGGLFATAAAVELSDENALHELRGIALVNPATGIPYGRDRRAVGLLASDASMVEKSAAEWQNLDFSNLARAASGAMALSELVPPQTLRHRVVDWLDRGCAATNGKLWRLRRAGRGTNVLVLAGGDDRFLPSASEAARLKKELPGCEAVILPRGGHAVLVDDERLDLSVALRRSRALYGAELRAAKARRAQRWVEDFLFGIDLSVLVDEFLRDRDLLIRGLAHPVATNALSLFDAQSDATGPPDYWADSPRRDRGFGGAADGDTFFQTFGAVEVSPRNFVRLMRDDAATDFVRVAAKYGADIVPFGAVGAADSFTIVRDKDEPLPFGGGDPRGGAGSVPSARRWANRTEDFRFPLAVPTSPRRFYFRSTQRFGEVIATADLDANDKDACAAVYAEARDACRGSIDWLLEKREGDAYENPLLRLPYEAASGAAAPTFEV
ncbi:hypothetical protein JL720_823 [Aureococcus anophagefferens]|nr:hypothetical protein JL720_823 [Aureococcus anophagefferens]